MNRLSFAACFLLAAWSLGCASSVEIAPFDAASDATSDGSSDGGTSSGDGCGSDADCPGGTCIALARGGLHVCQTPAPEATTCTNPFDECCAAMACASPSDRCLATPVTPFCGGAMMLEHNVCASDECTADAACGADAICVPAGTFGRKVRACMAAVCHSDADCSAKPNGTCAPIAEGCCGSVAGLFCTYPSDSPCRADGDCNADSICSIEDGRAHCTSGSRLCPL